MEATEQAWRDMPEYKRLAQLRMRRADGELQEYCEETDRILQTVKNDYRKRTGVRRSVRGGSPQSGIPKGSD